jgi:isopenicillin-N epimerase
MKNQSHRIQNSSRFRRHWALKPGIAFLNHGSFGACPKPILELQTELRRNMEAEPVQFLWRRYEERLEPARAALAAFLGARARDLVIVTNATTAANAVVRSLKLRPGDALLTTSHEYNACQNVLAYAARSSRARLDVAQVPFPLRSPQDALEAILSLVTKRTRLVFIDHVTSNTALIFPIERVIHEMEARGVDGAHAPGMVPLNLSRLRPAWYTGNLHKWVCAPKGAAFLWVRPDKQLETPPAVVSHGDNTPRPGYSRFQDRFDWAGTFDPTPWFCVGTAIRWLGELLPGGWPELRRRNHQLAVLARRLLCDRLQLEPPCPESMLGSMATLPLPERFQGLPRSGRVDLEQQYLYDRYGIEVPFMRFGSPERRCFRISAQIYNSISEYEYLATALCAL